MLSLAKGSCTSTKYRVANNYEAHGVATKKITNLFFSPSVQRVPIIMKLTMYHFLELSDKIT